MPNIKFITFLNLALSLTFAECGYIPPYFQFCKRGMPDLEKCILEYGQVILPKIAYTGIPEFKMKPLDPMYVGKVDILKGSSLGIVLEDTNVHGFGESNLTGMKVDLEKQHISMKFNITLVIKGKYNMDGQLLLIPLKGRGNYTVNLDKTACFYSYDFILEKNAKDGLIYPQISDDNLDCNFGKMKFNMENLFGGNKKLGTTINQFMTDNSELLSKDLVIPVLQAIQKNTKKSVNRIYGSIPYDEILPI